MNKIKQAQLTFKVSSIICIIIVVMGFYKINQISSEQKKLANMPMNDFKVMSQKNLSDSKDITVLEYKVVVNPGLSSDNLRTVSEDIVYQAQEKRSINGVHILLYGNTKEIQGESTVAEVTYAPNGKLEDALKGVQVKQDQYKYSVRTISKSLK